MLDVAEDAALHRALIALADAGLLRSAADLSDGGCLTAFAKGAFAHRLGVRIAMRVGEDAAARTERLFSEIGSSVIATIAPERLEEARSLLKEHSGVFLAALGEVIADRVEVSLDGALVVNESTSVLAGAWAGSLEEQLAAEVVLA